ncbi:hypothetical protein DFQ28_004156 [Apophysomyces sp. BC1034]|nr:hypothetical protein DFQ30_011010 [Apophysomyces sp. BC1015]KAG0181169.1 hypothetical protein DFQ29_009129 [Apophysomyces sp. BC1021]KAG0188931.1 hypothetical protein DFQ28_004156 [Apophysomyces sp. BC1034]
MGGPRLEVIKFGFYVFFPLGTMIYFGGPDFYDQHVKTIKFWPDYETTHKPPTTSSEIREELEKMKTVREERWRKALQTKQAESAE